MHIKDDMFRNFNHFNLDMDSIGNTSIKCNEIKLPYIGALPARYDTAYLFVRIAPGDVRLSITARQGKEKTHYIVEASQEEITNLLEPFFFKQTRPGTYMTRFGAGGLSDYWLGSYQRDFMLWRQYTSQPLRIIEIVRQLTPEQRAELYHCFQRMEAEGGEAWS